MNYEAQNDNLFMQIKYYTSELIKLNSEHLDTWAYQKYIRETKPMSLSNKPDQGIMQPSHLDHDMDHKGMTALINPSGV
jgi:hypothetical protein